MFNIGPLELVVLGLVAIVVFGPERLPQLARDAAAMIKSLREVAQGARTQLREELGPEFADVDLRNLNPKTAIRRALLGEDFELGSANPRSALLGVLTGDTQDEKVSSQIDGAVRDAVGTGISVNPKQAIKDALLGPARPVGGAAVSMTKDPESGALVAPAPAPAPAAQDTGATAPAAPAARPYVGDFDAT